MKLSVIVATRNRGGAITPCLDSIAAAFANAKAEAEIVVVDNGSTDGTPSVVAAWKDAHPVPVQLLSEPRPGKACALNRALPAARGELLAFTDDDCRFDGDWVNALLRHDAADAGLVLRSGRIELGDKTDLPVTVNLSREPRRWTLAANSARHDFIGREIYGCNMAFRRALADRIGPFDEDFGPGSRFFAGEEVDYAYRAYLDGATLAYDPDMVVYHYHGRKTVAAGRALMCGYMVSWGGILMKYLFTHPSLCRPSLWDLREAAKEIAGGGNGFMPGLGFSHKDKVAWTARGAVRYAFRRKDPSARAPREPSLVKRPNCAAR